MVELGADYGPWLARALATWRRLKGEESYSRSCSAAAVEANAPMASHIARHLVDNGLHCKAGVATLNARVGPTTGSIQLREVLALLERARARVHIASGGGVKAHLVSLVHMDVQGAEAHVVRRSIE